MSENHKDNMVMQDKHQNKNYLWQGTCPEFGCERTIIAYTAEDLDEMLFCPYCGLMFGEDIRMTQRCGTCYYHDDFSGVCYDGDSEWRGDFTDNSHSCQEWTEEDREGVAK